MRKKIINILLFFIVVNISANAKDWRESDYHEFRISIGPSLHYAFSYLLPYDYFIGMGYNDYYRSEEHTSEL